MANIAERWKRVTDYPSYEVSDCGRVRRDFILNPSVGTHGYPCINLCKNGKVKQVLVHRLVASAFLGPSGTCVEVNHINGLKADNRYLNLEWVTPHENSIHLYKISLRSPCYKAVLRHDGVTFKSLKDAATAIGGSSAGVCHVLKGRSSSYKGFKFAYIGGSNGQSN